jgi:endonuclease/exonuclease/phosphatase family metal-dependent hydrolase
VAGPPHTTFRLLTYNLLNGGRGRETQLRDVIAAIRPDVAVLTEVGSAASFTTIADAVGEHRLVGSNPFGRTRTAVVSRFPFVEMQRHGPWWAPRKYVDVVVRPYDGPALNVHGVHLLSQAIWPAELWRRRQVRAMLAHIRERAWLPQIIAGDFNTIARNDPVLRSAAPWWVKVQWMSQGGVIFRLALKPLMQAGYIDTFRTRHPSDPGFTVTSTRPSGRLDYIFASSDLRDSVREAAVVATRSESRQPSDHLPVWVDIEWPPKAEPTGSIM